MNANDTVRLQHMLDAAREALAFTSGKARDALDTERMMVLALVKCIEIIGEAARHLPSGLTDRYPEIPWIDVVGMRNRVIHEYRRVRLDRVWNTVHQDLPDLRKVVRDLLNELG